MPSDDIAIAVRNLSKTYRLFGHPGDRVKQFLSLGLKRYHREFTALKDVSFEVRKGETVGIVGRNGSGKSTLLQLICGILKPSAGTVQVNGRVSALLELGAGFNPEFTGRENVYFQGALMGFTRTQMDGRFDEIAAFADIGEFVDQPVRSYSSGMYVRLAFAVAISLDPEILVVDEALAVGDARFQVRCFQRINEIRDRGGSILFVTHATDQISRHCDRALLIDQGRLISEGNPRDVVNLYFASSFLKQDASPPGAHELPRTQGFAARPGYSPSECRFGNGAAEILDFHFQGRDGAPVPPRFATGQNVRLVFRVVFHRAIARATFAVAIATVDGINLFGVNSRDLPGSQASGPFAPGHEVDAVFDLTLNLSRGDYLMSLSVSEEAGTQLEPLDRRYDSIILAVENPVGQRGHLYMSPDFSLAPARTENTA